MNKNNEKSRKNNFIVAGQVAENRKARYDYEILETYEAGIVLAGSEVKALRLGKANITEGYARPENNEFYISNLYIGEFQSKKDKDLTHKPRRKRKLLLNKKEINKLIGAFNDASTSIVPLKLYFNKKGIAKLLLGIGKGKQKHDKRETIKKRDWERKKSRIMQN